MRPGAAGAGCDPVTYSGADHSADRICLYFNKLLKYRHLDNLKPPAKTRDYSAGVDTLWIPPPADKIAPMLDRGLYQIRFELIVFTGSAQSNLTVCFEL